MSNKKKMEVLYFVEQYIKRYGYPPTVRDIGKGLGYRSPSTVHGYLRQASGILPLASFFLRSSVWRKALA